MCGGVNARPGDGRRRRSRWAGRVCAALAPPSSAQSLPGEGHAGVGVGSVCTTGWVLGGGGVESLLRMSGLTAHTVRGPWKRVAGHLPPRVWARQDPGRASKGPPPFTPTPSLRSPAISSCHLLPILPGCGGHGRGTNFAAQTAWWPRVRGTPSWRSGSGPLKLEIPVLVDPVPSVAAPKGGERWLGTVSSDSPAA